MMALETLVTNGTALGFLFGVIFTAPITYFATVHFKTSRAIESFYQGKEAALNELHVERLVDQTEEGFLAKKHYLIIRERLVYKQFPLSPFWEHKLLVKEELNIEPINALANMADKLLEIADFKRLGLKIVTSNIVGKLRHGKNDPTHH